MKTMALPAVLMAVWAVQGSPYLAHRFSFNGDLADSVGIIVPEAQGHAFVAIGTGQAVKLSGGTKGSSCVSLGENAIPASGVSATVELWARLDAKSNYARIFETGFNNANGFMTGMAWQRGSESSDFVFVNHGKNNTSSATDRLSPYAAGVWYHLAMVFTPCENGTWTVRAYKQDAETGETLAKTSFTAPSNWTFPKQYQKYFYLGRTYAGGDNDAAATYDELRIWTRALSERELSASARLGPDAAIADGEFPFGVAAFDTSCDLAKSASGFTSQGGIDKLGDGVLALSGENKVGEGIMAYDGAVHQVGGTLIASNAAVSVGAYDEKSSGRFIASHGAILEVTAVGGSATTEPERRSELVMDNATLRPLGSDLGHFGPKLVHRWSFNGDLSDSVGGQTAKTNGACSYSADGKAISLSGGTYGSSFVDLGPNILPADAKSATIEMWARQDSASTWARIFEIGVNKYYLAAMCWNRAGHVEQDYIEIKHNNVSKSAMDKLCPYSPGTEYHIAITYYEDADGKWKATAYKQDAATGATFAKTTLEGPEGWSLASMYQTFCYLGHAVVSGGSDAAATYNEVRVWNGALTEAELSASALQGPDSPAMFVQGMTDMAICGGATIDTHGHDVTIESPMSSFCADALVHRWSFNGDLSDSVGGQTATTNGACSYSADGKAISLSGGAYGSSFVDLGPSILPTDTNAVTVEIWARPDAFGKFARVFEIGVNQYAFANICWFRDFSDRDFLEVKHNNTSSNAIDRLGPYSVGTEYHLAITYHEDSDGRWKATAYRQDATTGATLAKTAFLCPEGWSLASMYQTFCYLGHAVVSGGIDASATYNEVRVWKGALTEAELTRNALLGPDSALPAASVPALRKTGTGTLTLKNADSIRGRILIVEGVLNVESADALPRSASIEVAFDGNGGHGALSCSHGVLDLSGIFLDVTGTPAGRTRIITSTDGIAGKFAGKSLPAGHAVKISDTSVDVVLHGTVLTIR